MRNSGFWRASRSLTVGFVFVLAGPTAGFGQIVINEIMQNPGAVADIPNGEWFELYNAGPSAVDIDGWKLKDDLTGTETFTISGTLTIQPDGYLLFALSSTAADNGGLPSVDYVYPSSGSMRISLGNGIDGLILTNASDVEQDRVVWDNGSSFPDPNGASMALKATDLDTSNGDNWCESANVWTGSAGDKGTPGAANDCGGMDPPPPPPPPPSTFTGEIFQIQGDGAASPHVGASVTTENNVVTAVGTDGFFMQTPAARSDNNRNTSDGIFVATAGTPTVSVGDLVDVVGTVEEFFGFTRFASGSTVTMVGAGTVPDPVEFNATRPSPDPDSPSCALEYECYEGMLIRVAVGTIAGPSQRFGGDPMAEMFVTPTSERSFREPGLVYPGLAAYPNVPVFDGNPQVFELDPDKLGLTNVSLIPGSTFTATGGLGYEFGNYELWPSELTALTEVALPRPVRQKKPGEITVGSLNVLNLLSPSATTKLTKLSLYIREVLGSPDILGVQEVGSITDLTALADKIKADDPNVVYTPYLEEGPVPDRIDVGFLVGSRVEVGSVIQYGKNEPFENPDDLTADDILNDRPPLLLRATVDGFSLAVMVVHNRSLRDVATELRVRTKRLAQAQFVAELAQSLQNSRLIIVGDFNGYQFTDGFVDVIGQISGTAIASRAVESGPNLVYPSLFNAINLLPASEQYSYLWPCDSSARSGARDCEAQVLDHALVNATLRPYVVGMQFGRGNAEARSAHSSDATTSLATSDHDGFVVYVRPPARRPSAPSQLTVTRISNSELGLGWRDNSNDETEFAISSRGPYNNRFARIRTVPANTTSLVVGDLLPDSTYTFVVEACKGSSCSDPTPEVSGATGINVTLDAPVAGRHVALYFKGSGGFVGQAAPDLASTEDVDESVVAFLVTCGDRTMSREAEKDHRGIVRQVFNHENGLACNEGGAIEIHGLKDGGWYWINDEKSSAVSFLIPKAALGNAQTKPVDPGGVTITSMKGGAASFVKHEASGRVGILSHILPEPQVGCKGSAEEPCIIGAASDWILVGRIVDFHGEISGPIEREQGKTLRVTLQRRGNADFVRIDTIIAAADVLGGERGTDLPLPEGVHLSPGREYASPDDFDKIGLVYYWDITIEDDPVRCAAESRDRRQPQKVAMTVTSGLEGAIPAFAGGQGPSYGFEVVCKADSASSGQ